MEECSKYIQIKILVINVLYILGWIIWNCQDSSGFLPSEIAVWYYLKYANNIFLGCGIM